MPLFGGRIDSGTGATTPVYTRSLLGDLFGVSNGAMTATSSNWYIKAMTNQTACATQAALHAATLANTQQRRWLTNAATTQGSIYNVWWEDGVDHSQYVALAQRRVIQTRARTAEERARDEALRVRAQAEQLRLTQQRAAALERSKELLLAHLSAKQRETYQTQKWFVVEGGRSKQLYRINDRGSYSANIDVLAGKPGKPGKATHRLCCHLSDYRVPFYDHLLAQKIWIESDEDGFLRQANRHAA